MDRIDALLESYLETGSIPTDATEEERAELAELTQAAATLRAAAPSFSSDAAAAVPTARARFERFVAGSRASAVAPKAAAKESVGRRRSIPSTIGMALAGLALVAAVAIGASTLIDNRGVHTAHALEPGDYAQIEGVVTVTEDRGDEIVLKVATAIGNVNVDATEATSVVGADDAAPLSTVERGMAVYVGGVVTADRRIAAQTVAFGGEAERPPLKAVPRRFRAEDAGLQGRVAVFSLSEDASAARLVVSGEAGRLYVATITGESALELLALERPLGALVRLLQGPAGSFEVSVIETQSPDDGSQGPDATVAPGRPDRPAGDAPALVSIGGVVVDGGDGVLTVRTRRGLVTVETSQATRVASGRTGLSDDQVLDGEGAAGYLVVVRGGLDAETHNVLADVILVRRAAR